MKNYVKIFKATFRNAPPSKKKYQCMKSRVILRVTYIYIYIFFFCIFIYYRGHIVTFLRLKHVCFIIIINIFDIFITVYYIII